MTFYNRKSPRLSEYDYNSDGAYFITICTKDRKQILSKINVGTPVPTNEIIDNKNSVISRFVSTFKRFCNKEYGNSIWQSRYYDHIIRGEQDYKEIFEYIENNPLKWEIDELLIER